MKVDERAIYHKNKLRAFRLFDFRLHKWYRLKVTAKRNQFQRFIDDTKILDFLDDTYTEGKILFFVRIGEPCPLRRL